MHRRETNVPKMKGSAPKSSATGSQICRVRKDQPKACLGRVEFLKSSQAMAEAIPRMVKAKISVRFLNIKSPHPNGLPLDEDFMRYGGRELAGCGAVNVSAIDSDLTSPSPSLPHV